MADVVGEMEKGWNEKILFSITEFKGKTYADIRVYYEDDEGEWKPTKKGITVSPESFAEFKSRIEDLERQLQEKGHL